MIRLALLEETATAIETHLAAGAPLEEGAFCLLRGGRGVRDARLLGGKAILAPPGVWKTRAINQLRPSGQWLSQCISHAAREGAGLLFVHSHPSSKLPARLSPVDREAFASFAAVASRILDGPLATAVVHPAGWSAELWADGRLIPIDRIVAVGPTLRFLSPVLKAEITHLDVRQLCALGLIHDRLRVLSVGIAGCGGLGSLIAELLARAGVAELVIVDNDDLDTPSNLRRVFGSVASDLNATVPPAKVDVVGRHVEQLGLGVRVCRIRRDVRTEEGFRPLLDSDVVIIATDNHSSRAIVNDLSSTYLLPVIDVGVRVSIKSHNTLAGLLAEVRILTPTTPCLWCRGAINADTVRTENLPAEERGRLMREGYVTGYPEEPEPSVVALTVLGSGLAACALLRLLSNADVAAPSAYFVDGLLGDARERQPKLPMDGCRCRAQLGLGDSSPPPLISSN